VPAAARTCLNTTSVRPFSVAYNVKSKFEEAYNEKISNQSKVAHKG